MRVALLTGASPLRSAGGPDVRLQAGGWRIDVEGLIDSELELCVNSFTEPTAIKCGFLELERHADVSIGFRHRGSEAHISVYATRV